MSVTFLRANTKSLYFQRVFVKSLLPLYRSYPLPFIYLPSDFMGAGRDVVLLHPSLQSINVPSSFAEVYVPYQSIKERTDEIPEIIDRMCHNKHRDE